MNKNVYIVLALLVGLFGCKKDSETEEYVEEAPEYINHEVLMTRNPATGEVESHKLWQYLLKQNGTMGQVKQHSKALFYPNTWTNVDDQFASLAVQRLVYDPNNTQTFYFCTGEGWNNADAARGAGIWRSTDGGVSWNQLSSTTSDTFYYCHDMLVHPVTSDIYVATRRAGIMRSKDGGQTWEQVLGVDNGSLRNEATDIELTADNELVVCIGNFSTDGIYFSPTGNAGDWDHRMSGLPTTVRRIELATAPSNADVMYCIPTSSVRIDSNRIHGVYRSDDKGMTWDTLALPGGNRDMARKQGWYDLIVKVSPDDEDFVLVGGLNTYRTLDGGKSWQKMFEGSTRERRKDSSLQYVHVDQHEVVFKTSDTVLLGNDGGIYRCDDIKADTPFFYDINKNYNVTQFYACAIDAKAGSQFVIGGTQDNGSQGSTDHGISPFRKLSWADGSYCNIDHEDGDIFYTTTQYRRLYRNNHGKIDTLTNDNIVNDNTLFINPIEMDPNDPEMLYQLTNRGLWRLPNARTATADDWEKACRTFGSFSAIGISKSSPNTVYLGRTDGGGLYRIDNARTSDDMVLPANCDPNSLLPSGYCRSIYVDPVDVNHVVTVFSNYGVESVWESFDATADFPTWMSHEGDLPDIPIRWVLLHPENKKVCYLATEAGVMMTTELNQTNTKWVPINDGLANVKVNMIRLRESDLTILAATHGRGLYTGKIQDDYSIKWEERGPLNVAGRTRTMMFDPNDPSGKKLWAGSVSGGLWVAQDYDSINTGFDVSPELFAVKYGPNPVVNNTLTLYVDSETLRTLSVSWFTELGQEIRSQTYSLKADRYEIEQSTTNMASGMYFLKLESEDFEEVYKIVVL